MALVDEQNNINYYHNDQIGTPRELTNEQGQIVWEAQYKTWGAVAKESYNQEESKITQSFRFQGQYFDAETGLHYNRFRYYDPDIGRFISQDPIGLMGGVNLYQYAPNPVGWIDPFGLSSKSFGCDCDGDGKDDIFFRTMSKDHYEQLKKDNKLRGTGETSITQNEEFSKDYEGYLTKITTKSGTKDKLADIGISDGSKKIKQDFPNMTTEAEWKANNPGQKWGTETARFKDEKGDLTIQLGKEDGKALIFLMKTLPMWSLLKLYLEKQQMQEEQQKRKKDEIK